MKYLNDDGLLPTLCYTRRVLKCILFEDQKGLVDEMSEGDITDVEYAIYDRLTDMMTCVSTCEAVGKLEHPTDMQKKDKTERDEVLVEAILYGIPLKHLSRMTVISYGVIQRINGKIDGKVKLWDVGQQNRPPDFLWTPILIILI